MTRNLRRSFPVALLLVVSNTISGCAAPVPQAGLLPVAAQAIEPSCPGYVDVDRSRLAALPFREAAGIDRALSSVRIPEESPYRPRPDDPIVLTAAIPESGMHPIASHAVVWKTAEGSWMFWRRTFDVTWVPVTQPNADGTVTREPERYPSATGALSPEDVENLEFLLRHPCRIADPPTWPDPVPLARGGIRRCPLDAARSRLRIQHADGRREELAAACENETMTFRLITAVLGR